ncbi:ankyrin repeat domain-containing protein [Streptomyces sp. CC228A]|uniref:ankyrin repeat domain-containing protein n=1 Tax=Streptomyces sp. CC228A TaxID=2898186 RepID=UPI001F397B02|nr:ankyrin repeat domain-containing protein [Streptomyces sp. CC228A]
MNKAMGESLFAATAHRSGDDATRAALVRSRIAGGADPSARDDSGDTPLHRAVKASYGADDPAAPPDVVRALLECGAPIDAADARGDAPLHAAIRAGWPGAVRVLLESGADAAAVEGLGRTPLGLAVRLPEHSAEQRQQRHAIVSMLRAAGAPARVRFPMVEGGPMPIDMDAVRRVAAAMSSRLAEVCGAAGVPDDGARLARLVEPDFDSYQDLASALREHGDPELLPSVTRLCAAVLGDTGTVRTLPGGRGVDTPFFHHGDLVVTGDLDVLAPFVVTGSLTVEGVLADFGPHSVVVIGGGVVARGVFTDGEMCVHGDIRAEVVHGSYNDHTLQAATLRARLVIEDEHETIAAVRADLHFDADDYQQGYGDGVQEQLRELLVDEVFATDEDEDGDEAADADGAADADDLHDADEDGDEKMFDHRLLLARMRAGLPVFRTDAVSSTS